MTTQEKQVIYSILIRLIDDGAALSPTERRDLLNQLYQTNCNMNLDEILHTTQNNRKLRIKRGSTPENDTYTGLAGEITMDTDTNTVRIHDGTTVGGITLVRTDTLTNAIIPDYTQGIHMNVTKTEQTYTCPANGVVVIDISGFDWAYGYIKINGATMFNVTTSGNSSITNGNAQFLVAQGDIITYKTGYLHETVHPSTNLLSFYPFRGNK